MKRRICFLRFLRIPRNNLSSAFACGSSCSSFNIHLPPGETRHWLGHERFWYEFFSFTGNKDWRTFIEVLAQWERTEIHEHEQNSAACDSVISSGVSVSIRGNKHLVEGMNVSDLSDCALRRSEWVPTVEWTLFLLLLYLLHVSSWNKFIKLSWVDTFNCTSRDKNNNNNNVVYTNPAGAVCPCCKHCWYKKYLLPSLLSILYCTCFSLPQGSICRISLMTCTPVCLGCCTWPRQRTCRVFVP